MKTASAALKALLATGSFCMTDLYTITLQTGVVIRITTFDVPLKYGGNTFYPYTMERKGLTASCGLSVDDLEADMFLSTSDQINGVSISYMMHTGQFDNAQCALDVAFMPLSNPTDTSAGVIRAFYGTMDCDTVTGVTAAIKVRSFMQKLNLTLPRNTYTPACRNTVFDGLCGLAKSNFAQAGTIQLGSNQYSILTDLTSIPNINICGSATVLNNNAGVTGTGGLQNSLSDNDPTTGVNSQDGYQVSVWGEAGHNALDYGPRCVMYNSGAGAVFLTDGYGITLNWASTQKILKIEIDPMSESSIWTGTAWGTYPIHLRNLSNSNSDIVVTFSGAQSGATVSYIFPTPLSTSSLNIGHYDTKVIRAIRVWIQGSSVANVSPAVSSVTIGPSSTLVNQGKLYDGDKVTIDHNTHTADFTGWTVGSYASSWIKFNYSSPISVSKVAIWGTDIYGQQTNTYKIYDSSDTLLGTISGLDGSNVLILTTPISTSSIKVVTGGSAYGMYINELEIWAGVANYPTLDLGTIAFTSGANVGMTRTIKSCSGNTLNLANNLSYPVAEGDTFIAYPGCNKSLDMCRDVYFNTSHFRGYPFVPTTEAVT